MRLKIWLLGMHSARSSLDTSATSDEVARQIKAATNLLSQQLEMLCDLMKEILRTPPKREDKISGLFHAFWRAASRRFEESQFFIVLAIPKISERCLYYIQYNNKITSSRCLVYEKEIKRKKMIELIVFNNDLVIIEYRNQEHSLKKCFVPSFVFVVQKFSWTIKIHSKVFF